jgi:AcrR family transcriptional regulator
MKKRRYTLRARAAHQEETRRRIAAAAAALHEELGPANTTISAIADRAGVQRLTVYRHFPDDAALFEACSAHWSALNPPPGPGAWRAVASTAARTRAALSALYAYYRRTQRLWSNVYRDEERLPALKAANAKFEDYLRGVRDDLVAAWTPARKARRVFTAAAGHALRFATWQSLAREGLDDEEMAESMARWLGGLRRPGPSAGARGPDRGRNRRRAP